jgi:uncharacterized membrane protein YbhN (UPF0104 family)
MKKSLQLIIGLLISGVFLWYSFSKADFSKLGETFREINYLWTIPFVAVTLLTMVFRAARWHYLLIPARDISTRELFSPLMIGFALNGIFPARAGEFARAWIVNKKHQVPFTSAFATVVVERLYDLATLCGVMLLTFAFVDFQQIPGQTYDARWSIAPSDLGFYLSVLIILAFAIPILYIRFSGRCWRPYKYWLAGLLAAALGGILFISQSSAFAINQPMQFGQVYVIDADMLENLSSKLMIGFGGLFFAVLLFLFRPVRHAAEQVIRALPLPGKLSEQLAGMVHTVGQGLDSLTSWRLVLWVGFYTLLLWGFVAWSLQIMAWGFPGLADMTLFQGLAITMLVCLAIMIPAAPGYWGLYEVGCVAAIQLLGITQDYDVALSYSLVIHSLQMIPIIAIGLAYAAKENINTSEIMAEAEVENETETDQKENSPPTDGELQT